MAAAQTNCGPHQKEHVELAVSRKNRSGRYSEIERREAIARERADQQVVCSVRWDAYGRDAYGRQARWAKERVVALAVPATTSLRFTGGPHRPQRTPRSQGPIPIRAVGKK
jgi:hypothetical protein